MAYILTTPIYPYGHLPAQLAGGMVSAILVFVTSWANAACVANTSPTTSCDNLSLSQQYIDANVPGTVTITSTGANSPAVRITDTQNSFTNNGTLEGTTTGAQGLRIEAAVTTLSNTGTVKGYSDSVAIKLLSTGSVANLENSGQIIGGPSNAGITNAGGTITALDNSTGGSITSTYAAGIFNNASGTITTINNSGTISGSTYGISNSAGSTITTITNQGTITGTMAGIGNFGALSTLNNLQGASSVLSYSGTLPTNYNIIINSTSNYGKLAGSNLSGSTNFGIYTGSAVTIGTYSNVLSGFSASDLGTTTGTFNGYPWLLNNRTGTVWDLVVGLSTTDTQTSVKSMATSISTLIMLKNSALVNGFHYDCPISQDRRFCLATGARYTNTQKDIGQDFGGALIFAVRVTQRTRIGLYADQTFHTGWSDRSIIPGNPGMLIGGYIDWRQNISGSGPELRLSVGYEKNPFTITRSGIGYSEAGSGSTELISRGAQITAGYGFQLMNNTKLSPHIGVRRVQHLLEGYEENGSVLVMAPLSYSSVSTTVTTALAGMSIDVPVNQKDHLVAAAGLEYDFEENSPLLTPSGMTGLTSTALDPTTLRYRSKLMLSYYWLLERGQRISLTGIYQQAPYVGLHTLRLLAMYGAQF